MGNYHLYRFAQFLANALPACLSRALVMFLCDIHFCFSKADRQAVEKNLKIVLKTEDVPYTQVRAVFRNFGKYLLEFFTMTKCFQRSFIESNVRIKNIQYLNEALKKDKGGIVVSAHLGNWEMAGAAVSMLGFPLLVVALAHQDPRVNALFNAQREAFGSMVIQTDAAVRRVVEHLQKGRLVAILADRDFGNHGLMMDFLGTKAMIPKGAAFFSMRTGAPIIPVFFLRTTDGRFEINIHQPIYPSQVRHGKITDEMAQDHIRKYLTVIEDEIKKNPTQWLLFKELGLS